MNAFSSSFSSMVAAMGIHQLWPQKLLFQYTSLTNARMVLMKASSGLCTGRVEIAAVIIDPLRLCGWNSHRWCPFVRLASWCRLTFPNPTQRVSNDKKKLVQNLRTYWDRDLVRFPPKKHVASRGVLWLRDRYSETPLSQGQPPASETPIAMAIVTKDSHPIWTHTQIPDFFYLGMGIYPYPIPNHRRTT